MAGKKVYLGELFQGMNDKADQQIAKVDQQIAKLDSMVTQLTAITTNTANAYSAGKVVAGTNNSMVLNTTELYVKGASTIIAKLSCYADGVIRIGGTIRGEGNFSDISRMSYSKDLGTTWNLIEKTVSTTSWTPVTLDIPVKYNDVIWINFSSSLGAYGTYLQENTATVKYNTVNVAVDGFIVKQ